MEQITKTINITETEEKIIEMLTENTGTHFLDSGGVYGRNWERNKTKDFKKESEISLDVYKDNVIITKNVFHYLVNHLDITKESKKYQRLFDLFEGEHYSRYLKQVSDKIDNYARAKGYITKHDKTWTQVMEEFTDMHNTNEYGCKITNTYNFDNLIGQTLQYCIFSNEDGTFIILQLHNGCDVRGGYTEPKIFEINDFEEFIIDMTSITASCKCTRWDSDDSGYHWYLGEDYLYDGTKQLDLFCDTAKEIRTFEGVTEFDEENNKVTCKKCGQEIKFW